MKCINNIVIAICAVLIVILVMVACEGLAYASDYPELKPFTEEELDMVSKTVWGEARGCSDVQREAVVWCILNRVDDDRFPNTIAGVITQDGQFFGYSESNPVDDDIYLIARKAMLVWATEEMMPADELERVLPLEYVFFSGNGKENTFTTRYAGGDSWDLSRYEDIGNKSLRPCVEC